MNDATGVHQHAAQEDRDRDHQHPARERQGASVRSREVASQAMQPPGAIPAAFAVHGDVVQWRRRDNVQRRCLVWSCREPLRSARQRAFSRAGGSEHRSALHCPRRHTGSAPRSRRTRCAGGLGPTSMPTAKNNEEARVLCSTCGASFPTKQEKENHLRLHCALCRVLCGSREQLFDHMKEVHEIEAGAVFWPPDKVRANSAEVDDEWSEVELEAMDPSLFDSKI
jgi:hypothetical protein